MFDTEEINSQLILEKTDFLLQKLGFNGFSYDQLSFTTKIPEEDIREIFPNKRDLLKEILEIYQDSFLEKLRDIEQSSRNPLDRLRRFIQLDIQLLEEGRICPFFLLSIENPNLIKLRISNFFKIQEDWLLKVFQNKALFPSGTDSQIQAKTFLATMKGAFLLCRTHNNTDLYYEIVSQFLSKLTTSYGEDTHSQSSSSERSENLEEK